MYYSVYYKLKNEKEVKHILNFKSKEELIKEVFETYRCSGEFLHDGKTVKKEDLEFFKVIQTGSKSSENYENIKRFLKETNELGGKFLNDKFPSYYAKDITEEL